MESFRNHIRFLEKTALRMRIDTLQMTHRAQSGRIGSCLSSMDILVALYYGKLHDRPLMQFDSTKPGADTQDYFVLSKGHSAPAWYAVLADNKFFPKDELNYFSEVSSLLSARPLKKIPGISISSGSLAHGFSAACGLAMTLKLDKVLNRVFCLLGDGELQEGQVWEAAMSGAHFKLDNFIGIVDLNGLQIDGLTRSVMNIEPIADKFEAFGWKTIIVRDGHDFEELLAAFERAFDVQRRPTMIIAHTVKAKGVSFAENKTSYLSPFSDQEMAEAIPKLRAELQLLEKVS